MSDDQFTKLFKYVEEFRSEMNIKFDDTASQVSLNKLTDTIDGFVKRIDDNETEALMSSRQFEKLLEWARKVSKKTGIPLEDL